MNVVGPLCSHSAPQIPLFSLRLGRSQRGNRTGSSLCLVPNRAKRFRPLAFSHSLALNSNNGDKKSEGIEGILSKLHVSAHC
jgi:hypothetical protein